ncbi:MAG TPA: hypothetical protein VIV12_29765 [Streptosporangiaceae bacterium]
MAAPTLRAILAAIETQLLTIPGLRAADYAPGQITPPQAICLCPPVASYQVGLGDRRPILQPQIIVLVSAVLDRVGQLQLADYADPDSPTSIPKAIAANPTLGGVVGQCQVLSYDPLTSEDVGLLGYWGGRFTLRCTT